MQCIVVHWIEIQYRKKENKEVEFASSNSPYVNLLEEKKTVQIFLNSVTAGTVYVTAIPV
jgi:hypothetical protein